MTNAVSLRGDVLDMLGESLNNVSMSATQYLGQAKNTAVRLQIFRYVRLDPENPYTDCHISVDERDGEGRGEGYIRQIVVTNFNKSCKCRVIFGYLYLVIRLCWSSYPLPFMFVLFTIMNKGHVFQQFIHLPVATYAKNLTLC